jgi:hypothetical protein
MRNTLRLTIATALVLLAASPAAPIARPSGATRPLDIVKGTSLFEGYGAATHIGTRRLFAWSNEVGSTHTDLGAFVETNGGSVTRINARRTSAYVGGFDPGTDRVIYQQVRSGESDVFLYDISERRRTPLRALNDGHWQWNPSIDTHRGTPWILFGVNRFGSASAGWRLYLANGRTGDRILLDSTTNRCGCMFPGTVAYPWVTWAVGADATAWRYDIRTGERTPLLPTDRDEYSVTVTPDGTAYVAQAGDRCGSAAALYRVEREGTPFLIHEFRDRREGANLSVDFTGPHDRLYADRRRCRTGSSDILRFRRAEVIGEPARPVRAAVGGTNVTRSEASSGAAPRTR